VVLAAFDHTAADIGSAYAQRMINFPEVGIDPGIFARPTAKRKAGPQRTFLFVGRLVPYKLPRLAVEAFGSHPVLEQHRMIVIGDGPERP
jgi:glycosyltransferase involved in cell wall biosynthesis